MASGSEVYPAVTAAETLASEGIAPRVVSFPSWELFAEQSQQYQASVLPSTVSARLAVEAGVRQGWERWIGNSGDMISMDRFGASAPSAVLFEKFGFSAENIAAKARELLK